MVTSSLRLRSNRSRRSRISRAALLVKVTASICQGLTTAFADQVGDAMRDNSGLPGTRSGDNKERALGGDDGLILGFVKTLEDSGRAIGWRFRMLCSGIQIGEFRDVPIWG